MGASSVLFAQADPDLAFADSTSRVVAELLAGYSLIACGLLLWRRAPDRRFGVLLTAAGCGWFLLEWNNPGVGSPLVFTIGLVLYAGALSLWRPPGLTAAWAYLRRLHDR